MSGSVLLFDIGNTNIKLGIAPAHPPAEGFGFAEGALTATYVLPTDQRQTADALGLALAQLRSHAGLAPEDIEGCMAVSVVPSRDPVLAQACERFLGVPVRFAPQDATIPLENRYERPTEVGADRLLSAFAARRGYDTPAVVSVDFGTATTFDCVQGDAYLGGLICPGVQSSARALAGQTAKLPQVSLHIDTDAPVVGRSTSESLNQGFIHGFAAMVDGLVLRLEKVLRGPVTVVATGGFAAKIGRVAERVEHVRPDLLLEGLLELYWEQRTGA